MTLPDLLTHIRVGAIPKPGTLPVGEYSFALEPVQVELNEAGKSRMASFGVVSFKEEDYDLETFVNSITLYSKTENIDDKPDEQSSA